MRHEELRASARPVGWTLAWAAVAMLCLVGAVFFYGRQRDYAQQMSRMREDMRRQNIALTRAGEAFAILGAEGTRQSSTGNARVYVSPARGVLLIASQLAAPAPGRTYAMWLAPKSGEPAPAGVFVPDDDGSVRHVWSGRVDGAGLRAVMVSVENEGGAARPSAAPVMVAPFAPE